MIWVIVPIFVFASVVGIIWLFSYGVYKTNKVACEQLGGALYEGSCIDVITKHIIK